MFDPYKGFAKGVPESLYQMRIVSLRHTLIFIFAKLSTWKESLFF